MAQKNTKRSKPDHYSERARKQGYFARSVYKLEEINNKFGLLKRSGRYLDMGAAPGSWSQYLVRTLQPDLKLVSVDIQEMKYQGPGNLHTVLLGDMYDHAIQQQLSSLGPFDALLSDAAPNTMGNRTVDTLASAGMAEHLIFLARSLVVPGGSLVIKIFQGGEEQNLLRMIREEYTTAKLFKPKACRKESFESFLVGVGRK
ncbi:SAM-dependent methyltransferase [Spirochaeta africana]|uniref:Ribosomal RNA large subunit methyltransferase E n=1 Tax=Spirochaeta africana (strain ATCC 700263 / DSM 8902 / Z-7692) TaxID=889378 RepID=H9UF98_SPIAZ|nr:RlmE family RNA methyltransferase [Spirochaeta africana]AFG36191.1 23S rRNA methylase [Spirochaeta africana DSM 8902]